MNCRRQGSNWLVETICWLANRPCSARSLGARRPLEAASLLGSRGIGSWRRGSVRAGAGAWIWGREQDTRGRRSGWFGRLRAAAVATPTRPGGRRLATGGAGDWKQRLARWRRETGVATAQGQGQGTGRAHDVTCCC
jgi:hypothetical protein